MPGSAGVRGPQQMFSICWGARLALNEREARTYAMQKTTPAPSRAGENVFGL
jgi:hypothetical protein